MRFEVRIDAQGAVMWAHLAEDPGINKRFQIVINGGQGDGRNLFPHGIIDLFGRVVPTRRGRGVENDPALVRRRQAVFPAETLEIRREFLWHSYQMIIIINGFRVCPTSLAEVTGRRGTRNRQENREHGAAIKAAVYGDPATVIGDDIF